MPIVVCQIIFLFIDCCVVVNQVRADGGIDDGLVTPSAGNSVLGRRIVRTSGRVAGLNKAVNLHFIAERSYDRQYQSAPAESAR